MFSRPEGAELVYVSDIRVGDAMEGSTVALNSKGPNGHVIGLADGRRTAPMRGDHRYRVVRRPAFLSIPETELRADR